MFTGVNWVRIMIPLDVLQPIPDLDREHLPLMLCLLLFALTYATTLDSNTISQRPPHPPTLFVFSFVVIIVWKGSGQWRSKCRGRSASFS